MSVAVILKAYRHLFLNVLPGKDTGDPLLEHNSCKQPKKTCHSQPNQSPRDPDYAYRSEEGPDDSSEEEFDYQETLDDWMVTLRLEQRRMLAVTLMESFKKRQKMNVKEAATEAGSIVGLSEKTVRKYRNDFFVNKGHLTPLKREIRASLCVS